MIFHGRVSIDRLILGESLPLGSTKDNSFVAFFVLCVWYITIQHTTTINPTPKKDKIAQAS